MGVRCTIAGASSDWWPHSSPVDWRYEATELAAQPECEHCAIPPLNKFLSMKWAHVSLNRINGTAKSELCLKRCLSRADVAEYLYMDVVNEPCI